MTLQEGKKVEETIQMFDSIHPDSIQHHLRLRIKWSKDTASEIAQKADVSVHVIHAICRKIPYKTEFYTALKICNVLEVGMEEIVQELE